MKDHYEHTDELVRKRHGRWALVARHPLLRLFFSAGGDYEFLARHAHALTTSTGGNEVAWKLEQGEVVLSHQLMNGPTCRVDKAALLAAVARLATARRVARPLQARKSKPTPRATPRRVATR